MPKAELGDAQQRLFPARREASSLSKGPFRLPVLFEANVWPNLDPYQQGTRRLTCAICYSYNNLLFLQQSIILTTIYNSGETVIRLAPSCFELLDYLALLNSNQNPNCALGRQTSKEMQLAPNRLPKTSMASPDHQSRSARMASLVIYLRTTNIHDSWRTLKNQLKNLEKQEKTIKNLERLTKKTRNYKQQGY